MLKLSCQVNTYKTWSLSVVHHFKKLSKTAHPSLGKTLAPNQKNSLEGTDFQIFSSHNLPPSNGFRPSNYCA